MCSNPHSPEFYWLSTSSCAQVPIARRDEADNRKRDELTDTLPAPEQGAVMFWIGGIPVVEMATFVCATSARPPALGAASGLWEARMQNYPEPQAQS